LDTDRALWIKRVVLAFIVLALTIYLAPPPPPVHRIPGREQVVFWHPFAGEWQPIYESMVDRFNAAQDKYEVVPVSLPDSAISTKFLLSAAGGATPDLLLDWDPVLGTWSDKRLIRPFDEVMTPRERQLFLSLSYPIIKKHAVYKDKIMAMIDGLDMYAVYYRLDHLAEIGVDKDHLPKTLEDMVALGKRLDRYDSKGHLRRMGFLPQNFVNYVPAFGGALNRNGQIAVDTPESVRALSFVRDGVSRFGYDTFTRFTSSLAADAGPTMPLVAGNYSIMFDGEWRVKQVAQYGPDTPYIVVPLPAPKGGKPNASLSAPNYLVLPAAAKNPKGAWEFAKYCVGFLYPEAGGKNMGDMGWLPDDPEVARSASYQEYLRRYPQYKTFVDLMSSPNLGIPPRGPLQAFAVDQIAKAEDSVIRGSKTPQQALADVQQNLADEETRQRRLGHLKDDGAQ
jgi:multiple sugar transport system substrate-binding protein